MPRPYVHFSRETRCFTWATSGIYRGMHRYQKVALRVLLLLICIYCANQFLVHSDIKYAAWRHNDLSGSDFQDMAAGKADFDAHLFSHSNFAKATITDSSLRKTKFNGANMVEADFNNSDFYEADLSFVHAY